MLKVNITIHDTIEVAKREKGFLVGWASYLVDVPWMVSEAACTQLESKMVEEFSSRGVRAKFGYTSGVEGDEATVAVDIEVLNALEVVEMKIVEALKEKGVDAVARSAAASPSPRGLSGQTTSGVEVLNALEVVEMKIVEALKEKGVDAVARSTLITLQDARLDQRPGFPATVGVGPAPGQASGQATSGIEVLNAVEVVEKKIAETLPAELIKAFQAKGIRITVTTSIVK